MRFNRIDYNLTSQKLLSLFINSFKDEEGAFNLRKNYGSRVSYFSFVFLCGGNTKSFGSRDTLTKILSKNKDIKIIISEDIQSLRGDLDLLSFEIVLEEISKMVLISLESMGSACELGAFSNIGDSNKVVVILDKKYSKDVSFINQGPIQYLKEKDDGRVIITTFHINKEGKITLAINDEIRQLTQHNLIKNGFLFRKYYDTKDGVLRIIDLATFSAGILDYFCLFRFGNVETCKNFFLTIFRCNRIALDTQYIKDDSKCDAIIQCLLNIYVSLDFMKYNKGYYFINSQKIVDGSSLGESWIGRILFTSNTVNAKRFVDFKSKVIKETNNIYDYR